MNKDLDDKLENIIMDNVILGVDSGQAYFKDTDEAVAQIKKLYADEVTPKVDALVQDMTNLHANMKNDMLRLGLTPNPPTKQIEE